MARILLVEDEPLVAHMVRRLLERAGHQVDWAPSGQRALERFGEGYDLLICDLVMPGISGLEVIRKVRERSPIPILALSASVSAQSQEEALRAGAQAFLGKPFEGQALLAQLQRLLGYTGGEGGNL
ncbi:Response regulator receiver domain-containing protein [Thermus arciformis]|uniref:Response regulator receiver domain-containing protein n=1 Tax=Thermus arciformis TaxID=482827 RepID=A0A1G7F3N2_9DEIN|nr:response regulator [Thermus arciformis]SDE70135.1 Response regulator receiver domain-containing protein [Thermus arciformis]